MSIKLNMKLITSSVVKGTWNRFMILFDFLWVKLKDNYTKLVSFNKTTFWVHSKGIWHNRRESEVSWSICFVNKLNRLEFWFIQWTRSEKYLITWQSINVRNKRLWVTNKRMTNTSYFLFNWWSDIDIL